MSVAHAYRGRHGHADDQRVGIAEEGDGDGGYACLSQVVGGAHARAWFGGLEQGLDKIRGELAVIREQGHCGTLRARAPSNGLPRASRVDDDPRMTERTDATPPQ